MFFWVSDWVNLAKRDNFIHIYFKVWCPERYICKFSVCTISAMMINIEMVTFTQSVSGLRSSLKFFFCTGQMFRRTEQALERPWRCPRLRHRAGRGSRWEEPPRSDGRWRAPSRRSAWPVGWSTRTRRRGCWKADDSVKLDKMCENYLKRRPQRIERGAAKSAARTR